VTFLLPAVKAFVQVYRRIWVLILANFIALLLSIPFGALLALLPVFPHRRSLSLVLLGMLVTLLPSPAAAGLQSVMREIATGGHIFVSDLWDGLKAHVWLALRSWIAGVIGTLVILANVEYYPRIQLIIAPVMEIVWLYVLVLWLGMLLYVYPLIVVQDDRRVFTVYRNAFVLAARNRLYTTIVALLWLAVAVLFSLSGLVAIVGLAVCAGIQQNAAAPVLTRLTPPGAS
jgi:uncharacterized membrane protein YesL